MKSKLGVLYASLTVVAALLAPFLLMNLFAKGFVDLGLHVDERYTGGPVARIIVVDGHRVAVHAATRPRMLQGGASFVQLDWLDARSLPPSIDSKVDIDGDGQPDVRIRFVVPRDPQAPLTADITALTPAALSAYGVDKQRLDRMIARVEYKQKDPASEAIVVRAPLP